ncbi:MAG: hypothetical protein WC222_07675, partial [Parachlamydiales bacterium]
MGMFAGNISFQTSEILSSSKSILGNVYYGIKARVATLAFASVGTAASLVIRAPRVLENAATSLIKRDISYLGYAVGNVAAAATDLIAGALLTVDGILLPEVSLLNPITKMVSFNEYDLYENSIVLTESHWEARLISPFRGLSLAVKSLATGVYFLATAIFSQKV